MQNLMLFVTYTTKPGMREAFTDEILKSGVLKKIRRESGCLGYEYYQPVGRADEILLLEKWETEEQQALHLKQPHMEILKSIKNKYVTDTHLDKILF